MKLLQSFPKGDLWSRNRSFVVDRNFTPIFIESFDYREALSSVNDDVFLIEWDIVLSVESRLQFIQHCLTYPNIVQVAPYKLYPVSTMADKPIWAHRKTDGEPITKFTQHCMYFGFGCIYLPKHVITQYLIDEQGSFTDERFSRWHWRMTGFMAPIHWDVKVIHLHS